MKKKLIACTILIIMSAYLNPYNVQGRECSNKNVDCVCNMHSNNDTVLNTIDPEDQKPK